jgi:hypothetical protein
MNAAHPAAQLSTPQQAPGAAAAAAQPYDEDDVAIGCECANPPLQIEVWRTEAVAHPLHNLY